MTDRGDRIAKKLYIREYSTILRKQRNVIGLHSLREDSPASLNDGLARCIIIMICRNKQRIYQQAWNRWTKNTDVIHDYTKDLRSILLRKIPDDQPRSELEIGILCKWATQVGNGDPTGIAYAINCCKSKKAIINLFQHCRLECYLPNQTILFQGSLPRIEDGHFTIIQGEVDILCVQDGSVKLLQLQKLAKDQAWDEAKKLLAHVKSLASIQLPGGFGELATLSHAPRTASVRASSYGITELLVVPKNELLECIGRGTKGGDTGKAIDFLRQTGLASRISPKDLVTAANSMKKHIFLKGDILFLKGEPVNALYLVVSGDILLDVNDCDVGKHQIPFLNSEISNYYNLSSNSVLGDEGLTGQDNRYESSAVVVSNAAVIFEATGFSFAFLAESIGAIRYCALAYKELPRLSPAIIVAEDVNVYSKFNTLRKCISYAKPQRGKLSKSTLEDVIPDLTNARNIAHHKKNSKKLSPKQSSPKKTISKIAMEKKRLAMESIANSGVKTRISDNNEVIRTLAAVPMHHALDIYRTAKMRANEIVKIFARDNILNNELEHDICMPNLTLRAVNDSDSKLKTAISKYHERMREKFHSGTEDADLDLQLAEVHNIQNILGSMAANAINDDDDQNNDDDAYLANHRKSSAFDNHLFLEIQVLGPDYASLSRIDQYYAYIEYLRREIQPTSPINSRPTSPEMNLAATYPNQDDGSQSTINVVKKYIDKREVSEPWRPPSPSSKPHHELLAHSFSRPLSPKYLGSSLLDGKPLTANLLKKNNNTRPNTSNTAMSSFLDNGDQSNSNKEETGPKFWRLPVPKIRHCLQLDSYGNVINRAATFVRTHGNDVRGIDMTQDVMTNSVMDAIETSEEFWKAISTKEFPIRKSHRPKHLWVTRAVKVGPFAKNEGSDEWGNQLFGKYIDIDPDDSKKLKKLKASDDQLHLDNIHDDIAPANNDNNDDIVDKEVVAETKAGFLSDGKANNDVNINDVDENGLKSNGLPNINEHEDEKVEPSLEETSPRKNSLTSIASEEIPNAVTDIDQGQEKARKKDMNKWPEKLALSNPSSEAMDKYNELIRQDISSRKFLDGKRKGAISSKFILPRKISSAREIEYSSSSEDMSLALLSCLLPEDVSDSSIKESIKKQREEFLKPQLQFNTILNCTDNILEDASVGKKITDASINKWQKMTIDRVIDHQLGPKYTLPVLYKGKDGTVNRTKRFAGSLALLPPAREEIMIDGPTTFLELYRNNPKKTFRH